MTTLIFVVRWWRVYVLQQDRLTLVIDHVDELLIGFEQMVKMSPHLGE